MPKLTVYVTEHRSDLFLRETQRSKELIFYLPKRIMDTIKDEPKDLFRFDYTEEDSIHNDKLEIKLQETILLTEKPNILIVIAKKEFFERVCIFIKTDIEGVDGKCNHKDPNIKIEVIDIKKEQENQDLFLERLDGKFFPLYVTNVHYFKNQRIFRRRYGLRRACLN